MSFQPLDYKPKNGRPTKMTDETVRKLLEAYAIGATDGEACFYADISRQTLTDYQNSHPDFLDRKNALKERPVLLARQTVVKALGEDSNLAMKYLERKTTEFVIRKEIKQELTGELTVDVDPEKAKKYADFLKKQ